MNISYMSPDAISKRSLLFPTLTTLWGRVVKMKLLCKQKQHVTTPWKATKQAPTWIVKSGPQLKNNSAEANKKYNREAVIEHVHLSKSESPVKKQKKIPSAKV